MEAAASRTRRALEEYEARRLAMLQHIGPLKIRKRAVDKQVQTDECALVDAARIRRLEAEIELLRRSDSKTVNQMHKCLTEISQSVESVNQLCTRLSEGKNQGDASTALNVDRHIRQLDQLLNLLETRKRAPQSDLETIERAACRIINRAAQAAPSLDVQVPHHIKELASSAAASKCPTPVLPSPSHGADP